MLQHLVLVGLSGLLALSALPAGAITTSDYYSDQDIQFYDKRASDACVQQASDVAVGPVAYDASGTEDAARANRLAAMGFLIAKGLDATQAAGILGNLMQESGAAINPVAEEFAGEDRGGKGIAQWTASRRVEFETAAGNAGIFTRQAQVASLSATEKQAALGKAFTFNLNYLWQEAIKRGDIAHLKEDTASAVGDDRKVLAAVGSWQRWYERAGRPEMVNRVANGRQVFAEYTARAGGTGGNPVLGSPSGCGGAGATAGTPELAKAIQLALGEVGNGESDGSCQKYLNACQTTPWCAAFMQWVFAEAGMPIGGGNRAKGVGQWFEQNQEFYRLSDNVAPQPGDIFVRGRNGSGTGWDGDGHIGIIVSVNGNTIETVEGNSGNDVARNTYNDYHTIEELIGFGRYVKP